MFAPRRSRLTLAAAAMLFFLWAPHADAEPVRIPSEEAYVQKALEFLDPGLIPADAERYVSLTAGVTYVTFSSPVRFVPWICEAYYDITVALETETVYSQSLANPDGYESGCVELPFYTPSEEDWGKIRFVARAVAEAMDFDLLTKKPDGALTIYEREGFYRVEVVSEVQESWYKVEKKTGRLYDEGHVHLEPVEI